MKIKKIAYILCGLLLVSCNDSFLKGILIPICRIKHTLLPKKIWNFILILSIMS